MFYFRLSSLLLPLAALVSLETVLFWPQGFFVVLIVISALIIAWVFWLFKKKNNSQTGPWWHYVLLPLVFNAAASFYFSIEPNQFIAQLVIILDALFNYLKDIYYLAINSENLSDTLKNLSFFGGVLAVFFSASTAYGVKVFLGYPAWPIFLALAVALLFSWYQIFVFINFSVKKNLDFF